MDSQQMFDEFCQKTRNEGLRLAGLASRLLARPLTDEEEEVLSKLLGELGADRAAERLRALSPEQLQLWLGGAEPA